MIKYVAMINYVYQPYLDECLATLKLPRENIIIHNGGKPDDPGLAASLNNGIKELYFRKADWFIIINPAIRFGEKGGLDVIEQLEKTDANFIFFGEWSWHLCAIKREVFDTIGKLDPNFYPVYFEDIDFDLRYKSAFPKSKQVFLSVDAQNQSMNHTVELTGKKIPTNDLIAYFATKWGKHPMATDIEHYFFPFNDKKNSLAFWPPARGQLWNE